jgi:hypothetical protein
VKKRGSHHFLACQTMSENKNFQKISSSSLRSGFLKWEAFLLYSMLSRSQQDFVAVAEKLRELEGREKPIVGTRCPVSAR